MLASVQNLNLDSISQMQHVICHIWDAAKLWYVMIETDPRNLLFDVSQGSVLGPILFCDELIHIVTYSTKHLYADDVLV